MEVGGHRPLVAESRNTTNSSLYLTMTLARTRSVFWNRIMKGMIQIWAPHHNFPFFSSFLTFSPLFFTSNPSSFSSFPPAVLVSPDLCLPGASGGGSGLGTGAIVGILIVVFFLLLVGVDVTCYFLNKCGLLMCIAVNLCGKAGPGAKAKDMEEGKAAFT